MNPLNPDPDAAAWQEFAQAPLVPVAIAATVGVLIGTTSGVPMLAGWLALGFGLLAWTRTRAMPWLWLSAMGLAFVHCHGYVNRYPADDIGNVADDQPRYVRVRAILCEDPITRLADSTSEQFSVANDRDNVTVEVNAIQAGSQPWQSASGKARLSVTRLVTQRRNETPLQGFGVGDSVEFLGRISKPRTPSNPGEMSQAEQLGRERIRAELSVVDGAGAVTRLDSGPVTIDRQLARIRRYSTQQLKETLPETEANIATALLLGDGSHLEVDDWQRFIRSGVVHVLVISGQHLGIIAGFLWVVLRLFGVRRTRGGAIILVVIIAYVLLTGLRPSSIRAAAMVAALCGGLVLRRPTLTANAFALGWIVVIALNPSDPLTLGCQLSFLSVFILIWGVAPFVKRRPRSPLQQLLDEQRPLWLTFLFQGLRWIFLLYLAGFAIWVVNAPLILAKHHLIAPSAIVIGPIIVILMSVALIAGFLLLLTAPFGPIAWPFAKLTDIALSLANRLVSIVDGLPNSSTYTTAPPTWWVVCFYALIVAVSLTHQRWRMRYIAALIVWIVIVAIWPVQKSASDELRVTFLAVGHGGCIVMEFPDGRCLLYDAGSTLGPDITRSVIAPYLWERGIGQVDELFLSHGDADHFNGVLELARRFPIGQATLTPTFLDSQKPEVLVTLAELHRRNIPTRIAVAGDTFRSTDVTLTVLHPPRVGPSGSENVRSMVLLVEHAGHRVLLTGDLEKSGTNQIVQQLPHPVEVMMAPHHGSQGAEPNRLLNWSPATMLIVSRGRATGRTITDEDATVPVWATHDQGAVTVRSHASGLTVQAFRTGEMRVLK